ncbi:hypothetical protein J7438_21785 [Thalassotalea sp. G20_0]|nr:hypothetical protein [Thalassotalea sp. G20_0]
MDIPAHLVQSSTVSGSFHNLPGPGSSVQAYSRDVREAYNVLRTIRCHETTGDDHQQTVVPFHNPFNDSRFEKRSIVIVNSHTKKDRQPDVTVRNKRYDNHPGTSYKFGNQPFSIQSILGLEQAASQNPQVLYNNLHQPAEIFNTTEPVMIIQPQLATNSSSASTVKSTLQVSDARVKCEASDKRKEAKARASAKYRASEKCRQASARLEASPKRKAYKAQYNRSAQAKKARAKYAASPRGKETRARARAKYEASRKGKETRARTKYEASNKHKETRIKIDTRSNPSFPE